MPILKQPFFNTQLAKNGLLRVPRIISRPIPYKLYFRNIREFHQRSKKFKRSKFRQKGHQTKFSINKRILNKVVPDRKPRTGPMSRSARAVRGSLEQVFPAMKKIAKVFHELEETFLPEIFNEENNQSMKFTALAKFYGFSEFRIF